MSQEIDFNQFFNDSYEYVMKNEEAFYSDFYKIFINSSEDIRQIFENVDLDKQQAMLRKAIIYMINFFVSKVASRYLLKVAKFHAEILKLDGKSYDYFMDSLLKCLERSYPKYNSNCGLAWRITLAPGLALMKHAAEISNA